MQRNFMYIYIFMKKQYESVKIKSFLRVFEVGHYPVITSFRPKLH